MEESRRTNNDYRSSALPGGPIRIRVSPNSYAAAMVSGLFFSALLAYIGRDASAAVLLALTLTVIPILAFTDRIVFDGRRLRRTGLFPRLWASFNGSRLTLRLNAVEQVETHALRSLKRGGNVLYRYRTSFTGAGRRIVIASGGERYRQMIRAIFPLLADDVLDARSIELRDYLSDPKEVLMKADFAHIPSGEALEDSVGAFLMQTGRERGALARPGADPAKARDLRRLANELRLSGFLLPALEAFRRALLIDPRDNWLLFEASRCLNSYASAERDPELLRKSEALLRLAERRAGSDGRLLARIGESYFQFGDWRRAEHAFRRSVELVETGFRAARGMAEIALRDGKIAHVIHNFVTANRLADSPALRRWTKAEAEYFTRLNEDDKYLEMEIGRINLLETLERSQRTAMSIALVGTPVILTGILIGDRLVADIGWSVSAVALVVRLALIAAVNLFSARIPADALPDE